MLSGSTVVATTTTDVDGNYKFLNVAPGTYSIAESEPAAYVDGKDYKGGVEVGTAGTDQIDGVAVVANADSGGNVFTESGGSVSGLVYFDANQDRNADDSDHGIQGVNVHLLVLNDPNDPNDDREFILTTGVDGTFNFAGLAAGTFTLVEDQPAQNFEDPNNTYADGTDFQGGAQRSQ